MLKSVALVFCTVVNIYLLGAMVVFAAVLYPMLGAVDHGGLPALYSAFTARLGAAVVVWEFAALLASASLYWARPASVPSWSVHVAVGLGIAYFVITFLFHLPAHRALAAGDNTSIAMAALLNSQWARTVVQTLRALLLGWLAARAIAPTQ